MCKRQERLKTPSQSPHQLLNIGGPGNDTITGTPFGDTIKPGAGTNTVNGGSGKDHMYFSGVNDQFDGGDDSGWGHDILDLRGIFRRCRPDHFRRLGGVINHDGGQARFVNYRQVIGTLGNDRIDATGAPAALLIFGSDGDDELITRPYADRIEGRGGTDTCTVDPTDSVNDCEIVD